MSEITIRVKTLGNRYRVGQRERYKSPRDTPTKPILPVHFSGLPLREEGGVVGTAMTGSPGGPGWTQTASG